MTSMITPPTTPPTTPEKAIIKLNIPIPYAEKDISNTGCFFCSFVAIVTYLTCKIIMLYINAKKSRENSFVC